MAHRLVWDAAKISILVLGMSACKDPDPSHRAIGGDSNGAVNSGTNCLTATNLTTNSSWNTGIGTIFTNSCGSCHPGTQSTNYKTYAGVSANLTGVLTQIQNNSMPKGSAMAQTDKDAIAAWVAAGAPENETSTGTGTTPGTTTGTTTGSSTTGTTNCISSGTNGTATPTSSPDSTSAAYATPSGSP